MSDDAVLPSSVYSPLLVIGQVFRILSVLTIAGGIVVAFVLIEQGAADVPIIFAIALATVFQAAALAAAGYLLPPALDVADDIFVIASISAAETDS